MSLGYAEKLSYREDVGTVGMSEIFDPPEVLEEKVKSFTLPLPLSPSWVSSIISLFALFVHWGLFVWF